MAKGKKGEADKLVTVQATVPVVIWRANKPLTEGQHEELASKLQAEHERSGLKIMLIPNSVEAEIGVELEEHTQTQLPDESAKDESVKEDSAKDESEKDKSEQGSDTQKAE